MAVPFIGGYQYGLVSSRKMATDLAVQDANPRSLQGAPTTPCHKAYYIIMSCLPFYKIWRLFGSLFCRGGDLALAGDKVR